MPSPIDLLMTSLSIRSQPSMQWARQASVQVFFVGLPLSILIGFLFLLLLLGAMMSFFLDYAGGVLHALTPHG